MLALTRHWLRLYSPPFYAPGARRAGGGVLVSISDLQGVDLHRIARVSIDGGAQWSRCHSSVVERHLGKVEVQGSSPCGSLIGNGIFWT